MDARITIHPCRATRPPPGEPMTIFSGRGLEATCTGAADTTSPNGSRPRTSAAPTPGSLVEPTVALKGSDGVRRASDFGMAAGAAGAVGWVVVVGTEVPDDVLLLFSRLSVCGTSYAATSKSTMPRTIAIVFWRFCFAALRAANPERPRGARPVVDIYGEAVVVVGVVVVVVVDVVVSVGVVAVAGTAPAL